MSECFRPNLQQLMEELRPIGLKWRLFGLFLGVPNVSLEEINFDRDNIRIVDKLFALCNIWLNSTPDVTWKDVVKALKKIERLDIAQKVEMKYIKQSQERLCSSDKPFSSIRPNLMQLMKELKFVSTRWREFGLFLGISIDVLDLINVDEENFENKLLAVCHKWLQTNPFGTWNNIVEALQGISEMVLAGELVKKYIWQHPFEEFQHLNKRWEQPEPFCIQNDEAQNLFLESSLTTAMQEGGVKMKPRNIIMYGHPGAGKSSLKRVVSGLPPPILEIHTTNVLEKAVHHSTVRTDQFTIDGRKLVEVDDEELIKLLAMKVQSLHVTSPQIQELQHKPESQESISVESVSVSPQITSNSEAMRSIKEHLPKVKPSTELFDVDLIHVINSGNEPQLLDIFPILFCNEALHIVVINLDEGLDDKPKVHFYDKGKDVYYTLPDHLTLSNREFIVRACQMAEAVAQATSGKCIPWVMVVGTHKDKLNSEAKLKEINKELTKVHQKYNRVLIRKSSDEVIFAVNAMAPDGEERQQYTEELRKYILEAVKKIPNVIDVPLKWLAFYLDLVKRGSIVRKSEYFKKEDLLEMGKGDGEVALKYFHNVGLLIYHPDDLPDLIFTKPDLLFNRLFRLIKASFISPGLGPTGESERLRQKGLFNKSFLSTVFLDLDPSREEFSNDEFLNLLEYLLVVVHTGEDEYFLPIALSFEPYSDDPPFKPSCVPLLFIWNGHITPHGFFFALVVELLQQVKYGNGLNIELHKVNQCRDVIQLTIAESKIHEPGIVKLMDKEQWIEIRYSCSTTRYCFDLRNIIGYAINSVMKRLNLTGIEPPRIGFRCHLCLSDNHYCVLSRDEHRVQCFDCDGPVTPDMLCWINKSKVEYLLKMYKEMYQLAVELGSEEKEMKALTTDVTEFHDKMIDIEVLSDPKAEKASELFPKFKDAAVQFDYWVPMEDLLYGACVVDEVVFNVHGDKQQFFDWSECGFRLFVPEGALSPTETCPVAVKALIGGSYILPKGAELVSALYAISTAGKFQKDIKIEMQHCLLLESETQTKCLNFIEAHQTKTGRPYSFDIQKGGEFPLNNFYAVLWQSHFCIKGIVKENGVEPPSDNSSHTSSEDEGGGNEQNGDIVEAAGDMESNTLAAESNVDHSPSVYVINQEEIRFTVNGVNRLNNPSSTPSEHHVISGNQLDVGNDIERIQSTITSGNQLDVGNDIERIQSTITSGNQLDVGNDIVRIQSTITSGNQLDVGNDIERIQSPRSFLPQDNAVYRGLIFYKWVSRNNWIFKFVVVRHTNVHIKYVKDSLSSLEQGETIVFRFNTEEDSEITLKFPEKKVKGWTLQPHSDPCQVSKEEVDLLASRDFIILDSPNNLDLQYPDLPSCMVSLFADDDAVNHLQYGVTVEGTTKDRNIFIIRFLETSYSRVVERKPEGLRRHCKPPEDVPSAKRKIQSSEEDVYEDSDDDIMKRSPVRKDVYKLLRKQSIHYDEFALQLDIDDDFRDNLRAKNEDNQWKLEQVLRKWIDSETCEVTWAKIIEVLKDLEMISVAKEVVDFLGCNNK